jgi:dimeric dUTPase (all-alpha-NTP-PPase superfamily)
MLQLEKAYSPILVTKFGIVIDAKLEHVWNVLLAIVVSGELGEIITDVKSLQYWKAA